MSYDYSSDEQDPDYMYDYGDDHGSDVITNGHHVHSSHSMKMYFYCSKEAVILFSFWHTSSWAEMLGSCISIFLLAGLYEGLKVFREYLLRKSVNIQYHTVPMPKSGVTVVSETHKTVKAKMLSLSHLIQTLLHVIQIVVSYFLMLIFMTYNVWLYLGVALGAGAGYFIFSWRRAIVVDINEHCH